MEENMAYMYRRNGIWRAMICKNGKRKDVPLGPDLNKAKIIKASLEQVASDDRFKKHLVDTLIELGFITQGLVAAPTAVEEEIVTWAMAQERLKDHLRKIGRAETTIVGYEYMFKSLTNVLNPAKPSDITNQKVDQWIETLINMPNPKDKTGQTKLKPAAVSTLVRTAKAAYQKFVRWQYVDQNPFKSCEIPKVEFAPPRPLTPEEIEKLLKASNKPLKRCIEILINSGMRPDELYHLPWSRVVMDKDPYIFITQDGDWHPKAYTQRKIPITAELQKALGKLGKPEEMVAGRNECYFPVNKYWLTRSFTRAVNRAGLDGKKITVYCCRDTYATNLAMQGYEAHVIAARLGHRDIGTSMRYVSLARLNTADVRLKKKSS
jgi:site-specific recombinase XerD